MSSEKSKKQNSYYLRTQSTILRGQQCAPFNFLKSKTRTKKCSLSKSKNKSHRKGYINFSTGNKSLKSKKYINSKKNEKIFSASSNFVDLRRICGSSHSPNMSNRSMKNYKNNKNIIPFESNGFSLHGSIMDKDNKISDKNIIENFDININSSISNNNYDKEERKNNANDIKENTNKNNEKNFNKKIYNPKLYTPLYDLMDNINQRSDDDKKRNNNNNDIDVNEISENIPNDFFLNTNHFVEINNNINSNTNTQRKGSKNNKKINIKNIENKDIYIIEKKYCKNFSKNSENEYLNKKERRIKNEILIKNYLNNNNSNANSPPLSTQSNEENITNRSNKKNKLELKDSILSKTKELLKNIKNEKSNIINNYITQNNTDSNENNDVLITENSKFNSYNQNNPNLNYKIDINNKIDKYNDNYNLNNNRLPNNKMINYNNESKDYSMNRIFNRKNEINDNDNDNDIENDKDFINLQLNNKRNSYFNNSNNNILNNKSFRIYDGFSNKSNASSLLPSKYFLKSVFDQNTTNNFVNELLPQWKKKNRNTNLSNFNFNNLDNLKIEKNKDATKSFFNMQKNDENKLDKLLKAIPCHKKEEENKSLYSNSFILSKYNKPIISGNNNKNNKNNNKSLDVSQANRSNNYKTINENEGIMPANILLREL